MRFFKKTVSLRMFFFLLGIFLLLYVLIPWGPHFESTQSTLKWPKSEYSELEEWPTIQRKPLDPVIEQNIDMLLAKMTLAEKISQMTQGDISRVTPEQAKEFTLGSVLNAGGEWPGGTVYHDMSDWLSLADAYWEAGKSTRLGIPMLWGTDAVHGHNNFFGATLFPHNIGLGASGDIDLIRDIARATAQQVVATGVDWTFAPSLAVAQNPRWGRTYESFGQYGDYSYHMGKAAVEGYQAGLPAQGILATAKHFIADGALTNGKDYGVAWVSENNLIQQHAQGFYGALEANVQVVMAYFSRWKFTRLTAHKYLITDVLKERLGFDGFVITDFNAIGGVEGCTDWSCAKAINAGIDMVMVPFKWQKFIETTIAQVESGEIEMARIDDAVRRILRVKFRAGLFDKPSPSDRVGAGELANINSEKTRALARKAVQQTLVMLKNNHQLIPLNKDGTYIVFGEADSIPRQTGGWSLSWQGSGWNNELFPNGNSILDGIRSYVDEAGGHIVKGDLLQLDKNSIDAAIVVLAERSYAESTGDIPSRFSTAADRQQSFSGLEALADLNSRFPDLPIVTVYIGGRPLWMNPQLNQSDAFVVAWLPGTQGMGVADGLFGDSKISGRLPMNWPAEDCTGSPAENRNALFPVGYGLTFSDDVFISDQLPERASGTWGSLGLTPKCLVSNYIFSPLD